MSCFFYFLHRSWRPNPPHTVNRCFQVEHIPLGRLFSAVMNELLTKFGAMPLYMIEILRPCAFCGKRGIMGLPRQAHLSAQHVAVPIKSPAPLHKVEAETCHSLNRIYGLSLRHKLDSKYITVEVASPPPTCLHCRCARINTARDLRGGCSAANETYTFAQIFALEYLGITLTSD